MTTIHFITISHDIELVVVFWAQSVRKMYFFVHLRNAPFQQIQLLCYFANTRRVLHLFSTVRVRE